MTDSRTPNQVDIMNGFRRPFYTLLGISFLLVGTVWAITWGATENKIEKVECRVEEQREILSELRVFVARQEEINKNQEKINEQLKEILDRTVE